MIGTDRPRDVGPPVVPLRHPTGRCALIVGVSKTRDPRFELRAAERDARAIHELLVGQGLAPERARLLVDADATTANLRTALAELAACAAPDDVLILYLACHGYADEQGVCLVTHDTRDGDIRRTGVSLHEVTEALRATRSRHLVMIADTCHSAGLARAEVVNAALETTDADERWVSVLSSASLDERAFEGPRWNDHGAFTYHLLRGLAGAADGYRGRTRNGVVTVGELFDFVRDAVQRDVEEQHPAIGNTKLERELVLAVTGAAAIERHLLIGDGLCRLAWQGRDRRRFEAAARHHRHAIELSRSIGASSSRARFALGASLIGSDPEVAAGVLSDVVVADPPATIAVEAHYHLGIAYASAGDPRAVAAYDAFAGLAPHDERVPWIRAHRAVLLGRRRIAVVSATDAATTMLTDEIASTLRERYGFDVYRLEPQQPAFPITTAHDEILAIYVEGILQDTDAAVARNTLIEIDRWLRTATALQRTAVIDADGWAELLARRIPYNAIVAAAPRQFAFIEVGAQTAVVAPLAAALRDELASVRVEGLTCAALGARLQVRARAFDRDHPQVVQVVGGQDELWIGHDPWLATWRFGRGSARPAASDETIERSYRWCDGIAEARTDPVLVAFGQELLSRGHLDAAVEAFASARTHPVAAAWEALTRYSLGDTVAGAESLRRTELVSVDLAPRHPCALLVGIDRYPHLQLGGARAGVERMSRALQEQLGIARGDIIGLCDADATRENIEGGLAAVTEPARTGRALFYFAGVGTIFGDGSIESLAAVDSRIVTRPTKLPWALFGLCGDDDDTETIFNHNLSLADLAMATVNVPGLIAILDVRCDDSNKRADSPAPASPHRIGAATICASDLAQTRGEGPDFTGRLLDATRERPLHRTNLAGWLGGLAGVRVIGELPDGPVLRDLAPLRAAVVRIEDRWLEDLERQLQALADSLDAIDAPSAAVLLDLGAVHARRGTHDRAIAVLSRARELLDADDPLRAELDARLGSSRLAIGDAAGAVSSLDLAARADPADAGSHFQLARAIHALVQAESSSRIGQAIATYRALGAPLGEDLALTAFVDRLPPPPAPPPNDHRSLRVSTRKRGRATSRKPPP